jgi:glutathione S-transferase
MITLHHLENSRSQRIAWLLEELGLDYRVEQYKRQPPMMLAPAALKKVHPLGKSPVITDDAITEGDSTIAESGAIIEYLIDRYADGKLRPADGTPERRSYTYWLHFAEGSIMPLLVMKLVFGRLSQKPIPFFLRPVGKIFATAVEQNYLGPTLTAQLDHIEATLGQHPWFAGETFTGADIQMSFPLQAAATRVDLAKYPNVRAWLTRIEARQGFKAAVDRVGPVEPM